jgi:hypothetical protein
VRRVRALDGPKPGADLRHEQILEGGHSFRFASRREIPKLPHDGFDVPVAEQLVVRRGLHRQQPRGPRVRVGLVQRCQVGLAGPRGGQRKVQGQAGPLVAAPVRGDGLPLNGVTGVPETVHDRLDEGAEGLGG